MMQPKSKPKETRFKPSKSEKKGSDKGKKLPPKNRKTWDSRRWEDDDQVGGYT